MEEVDGVFFHLCVAQLAAEEGLLLIRHLCGAESWWPCDLSVIGALRAICLVVSRSIELNFNAVTLGHAARHRQSDFTGCSFVGSKRDCTMALLCFCGGGNVVERRWAGLSFAAGARAQKIIDVVQAALSFVNLTLCAVDVLLCVSNVLGDAFDLALGESRDAGIWFHGLSADVGQYFLA